MSTLGRELLSELQKGSHEALSEAYVRHGRMVYNVCLRVLEDHQAAEDATQAVFLLLLRKARSIRSGTNLAGWLHKTASFLARRSRLSAVRRRRRESEVADMRNGAITDAPTESAWTELTPQLDRAVGKLPDKFRLPLVLVYLEGQSHKDAARALRIPMGTLAWRLTRGLEKLRARLRGGNRYSAALIAGALAQHGCAAQPPADLLPSILTAAESIAAGAANGAVPAAVQGYMEVGLRAMYWTKAKFVAGVAAIALSTSSIPFVVGALRAEEQPTEESRGKIERPDPEPKKGTLPVQINETGVYTIRGTSVPASELGAALKVELKRAAGIRTPQDESDLRIVVKADDATPFLHVLRLMTACMKARIAKVSFDELPVDLPGDEGTRAPAGKPHQTETPVIYFADSVPQRRAGRRNRPATFHLARRDAKAVADPQSLHAKLAELASARGPRVELAPRDAITAEDQRIPYHHVKQLVAVCRKAGLTRIAFHTFPANGANRAEASRDGVNVIRDIEVRGNRRVKTADILNRIQTRSGSSFDRAIWDGDWQRLVDSKLFKTVRTGTPARTKTGVKLVIEVVEFPLLTKISFTGNDSLDRNDLLSAIQSRRGGSYTKGLAHLDARAIEKHYRDTAFRDAKVSYQAITQSSREQIYAGRKMDVPDAVQLAFKVVESDMLKCPDWVKLNREVFARVSPNGKILMDFRITFVNPLPAPLKQHVYTDEGIVNYRILRLVDGKGRRCDVTPGPIKDGPNNRKQRSTKVVLPEPIAPRTAASFHATIEWPAGSLNRNLAANRWGFGFINKFQLFQHQKNAGRIVVQLPKGAGKLTFSPDKKPREQFMKEGHQVCVWQSENTEALECAVTYDLPAKGRQAIADPTSVKRPIESGVGNPPPKDQEF